MNIVLLIDSFNVGGRENVVLELANRFSDLGHSITVIVLDEGMTNNSELLKGNVNFVSFDIIRNGCFTLNLLNYIKLVKLLRKINPDIIHYHIYAFRLLFCCLMLKIARINSNQIRTVHTTGLFYEDKFSLFNKIRVLSEQVASRISDMSIIGISNAILLRNKQLFRNKNSSNHLIYNGVDIDKFNSNKREVSCRSDIVRFIYLSRLDEGKNHEFILRVWHKFISANYEAHLYIAGDGPLKSKLLQLSDDLSLKDSVTFLGNVSQTQNLLNQIDIAFFPSSYEGFSLVLLEYFASSLPVIASNITSFSEIGINDYNVFLIDNFDESKYLYRIIELYNDKNTRLRIGANAYDTALRFSMDKFIEKHLHLYSKILANQKDE